MVFEDKVFEKKDQKTISYYGSLTVSSNGIIKIPCRGRILEVEVSFSDIPPSGCGPTPVDTLDIEIEQLVHPFPLYAVKITWDINTGGVREIEWRATVIR